MWKQEISHIKDQSFRKVLLHLLRFKRRNRVPIVGRDESNIEVVGERFSEPLREGRETQASLNDGILGTEAESFNI